MKARITVTLKPEVLDPQGKAIQKACSSLGYASIQGVRQGKYFEIHLDENDASKAQSQLHELCEKLLANPVIENYNIESID